MRPARRAAATVLVALLVAGCAGGEHLTLDDLDARELAGWNGPTVADQCGELPRPTSGRWAGCGRGPSTGEINSPEPAGDYVIVLFCEPPGTYRLEATKPADAFEAFEVECSDDDDPAIGPRFSVPEQGIESFHDSFDGEAQNVAMLFRVPDGA